MILVLFFIFLFQTINPKNVSNSFLILFQSFSYILLYLYHFIENCLIVFDFKKMDYVNYYEFKPEYFFSAEVSYYFVNYS